MGYVDRERGKGPRAAARARRAADGREQGRVRRRGHGDRRRRGRAADLRRQRLRPVRRRRLRRSRVEARGRRLARHRDAAESGGRRAGLPPRPRARRRRRRLLLGQGRQRAAGHRRPRRVAGAAARRRAGPVRGRRVRPRALGRAHGQGPALRLGQDARPDDLRAVQGVVVAPGQVRRRAQAAPRAHVRHETDAARLLELPHGRRRRRGRHLRRRPRAGLAGDGPRAAARDAPGGGLDAAERRRRRRARVRLGGPRAGPRAGPRVRGGRAPRRARRRRGLRLEARRRGRAL